MYSVLAQEIEELLFWRPVLQVHSEYRVQILVFILLFLHVTYYITYYCLYKSLFYLNKSYYKNKISFMLSLFRKP